MKLIADLHTHTLASSHALSTITEMVSRAQALGLKALAITDHAPALPDAPHKHYFTEILHLPDVIDDDFLLLKGVEANIISPNGDLDLPNRKLERLDWVIASLHHSCQAPMGYEAATRLWLRVAENPCVDMIGHSETKDYLYDYEAVVPVFAANNKVVELNAGSARSRPGNEDNLRRLALCCKAHGAHVAVNTDAHSVYALGHTGAVLQMLKEIDFPSELVVNASMKQLIRILHRHKKPIAQRAENQIKIPE